MSETDITENLQKEIIRMVRPLNESAPVAVVLTRHDDLEYIGRLRNTNVEEYLSGIMANYFSQSDKLGAFLHYRHNAPESHPADIVAMHLIFDDLTRRHVTIDFENIHNSVLLRLAELVVECLECYRCASVVQSVARSQSFANMAFELIRRWWPNKIEEIAILVEKILIVFGFGDAMTNARRLGWDA
jgi:hypothetical protein